MAPEPVRTAPLRTVDQTGTADLVERWLAGDAAAAPRLVDRQTPRLAARARRHAADRRVRSELDPQDLVSETWLRVLSAGALARFRHQQSGSLGRYLTTVLRRTFLDALRKRDSDKRRANAAPPACVPFDGGPSAAESMEDRRCPSPTSEARVQEWLELVRQLLDEPQWFVWHGIEVERRSSVELAAELGISDSAVRGVLFRARALVIERLASDAD